MAETFRAEEREALRPYVTNVDRPVFALRNLPEEVVAVLFAYYSRSRDSLRRNLLKLMQDNDLDLERRLQWADLGLDDLSLAKRKAKEFHEKWVVGYGHASVAEHAVAHLAVEDVSIVASKVIEDTRLASFTEKSTRYVVFDRDKFYREPAIMASAHAAAYEETCRFLLDTYTRLMDSVAAAIRAETPRGERQSERAHEAACRAKACDVLRYLLPASTLTNIGMTINGRLLEHLIIKLLSHPLAETRRLGALLKEEAEHVIPTLIKYAGPSSYLTETMEAIKELAEEVLAGATPASARPVSLVRYPADAEDRLVAAVLYGFAAHPLSQIEECVRSLPRGQKVRIIDEYLKRRGPHDQPLRALEHLTYTFDILVDFGAFRDIQRHRMITQTPQESTAVHGYSTPSEIACYGLSATFDECMHRAQSTYERIARDLPRAGQYILPLAFRKRVLFTWNLREIHHFVQLRSGRQGHVSYREIAQQVFTEVERVHPLLAQYIRVDLEDYSLARS